VTNTRLKEAVRRKWTHKDYYKYLDEFWVVVFSDSFKELDYIKWNDSSPDNVKVFSIYQFLEELDYSVNEQIKDKINKLEKCTFRTKEQFKKKISLKPYVCTFVA